MSLHIKKSLFPRFLSEIHLKITCVRQGLFKHFLKIFSFISPIDLLVSVQLFLFFSCLTTVKLYLLSLCWCKLCFPFLHPLFLLYTWLLTLPYESHSHQAYLSNLLLSVKWIMKLLNQRYYTWTCWTA